MERIKLKQAVIVEGKYDQIKLEALLDALIIPVGGFGIYKNREQQALLRSLAGTCGLIVLTDSDAAGFRIRGHISGIVPDGEIIHVYIPDVPGKEKRKAAPSAEGKLGVEGLDLATLRECFHRAGVLEDAGAETADPITRLDLFEDGISGGEGSAARRRALYRRLGLPQRLSANAALIILNRMLTRDQYKALVRELSGRTRP